MNTLEIIHVRSSETDAFRLVTLIRDSIQSEPEGSRCVTIYRRAGLETDVAIHIPRHAEGEDSGPSTLGLHLASALGAFGLVEHTVWEELK